MDCKRGSEVGDYGGIDRPNLVIPAKAGIQGQPTQSKPLWIPAFAGMTEFVAGSENANPVSTCGRGVPTRALKTARRPPRQGEGGRLLFPSGKPNGPDTGSRSFGVTPYAPSSSAQASYAVLGRCIPIAERFPRGWEA